VAKRGGENNDIKDITISVTNQINNVAGKTG
jgi:hypothetical protein